MIADSVRLALPSEGPAIAAIQRRAWEADLPPGVSRYLLDTLDPDTVADRWTAAIARPPLATLRVLVAVSGREVAGFACVGPSADPDAEPTTGEVGEFVVDPRALGRGHGSRLVNACADTLRADGFTLATWWVRSTDDALRAFLASCGWAPDGAHQEVATQDETASVKLVRLHTAL